MLRLRDAVYVQDQQRLADVGDTASSFDRFDTQSRYIVGYQDGAAVGTIKVVPDSPAGLPCDGVTDLATLRTGNRLVEFGHLMTLPEARSTGIGMALMREALVHSVCTFRVTHILGDFFVDDDGGGGLRDFYTGIGFLPLHGPYQDDRFQDAPLSMVAVLDVPEAARRSATEEGRTGQLLRFFFHDYPFAKETALANASSATR
ncbi:GNAT family N-acetyltransferase [Streptomyces sp. NPDC001700]